MQVNLNFITADSHLNLGVLTPLRCVGLWPLRGGELSAEAQAPLQHAKGPTLRLHIAGVDNILYGARYAVGWRYDFAASQDFDGRFSFLDFWEVHLLRAEVNGKLS